MNGTYTTHQVLILCDQDFAKIRTKIKFLGIFSRDEEFYIPYGLEVKDTGSLFLMAYSWIGYYNTRRAHTGESLDGKTPIGYAKEVMPELKRDIALFPPVILDNLTTSSYWKSVNKVPTHYMNNPG
uniref:Uncharacterized protein n=1 Tax=candidate division WOR-3 bacterium TaxID=2052148 RepID=A0A7V3RHB6_UNCW3